MKVDTFEGQQSVDGEQDLERLLRSVRSGDYGGFMLWHDEDGPSLSLLFNKDMAFAYFFPDQSGEHPGYQSLGGLPDQGLETVHFLQAPRDEGSAFDIPWQFVVTVDTACKAAKEFLRGPERPPSISWFEL